MARAGARLTFHPATPVRWADLARLFGPRGAQGGCWCMWWRLGKGAYDAGRGAKNREGLRRLVAAGPPPGILAYAGDEPIGWCALAPRDAYPRLARSRVLAPVDQAPVWSVTCFYVARAWRGRGVTRRLLDAAVRFARASGARMVEAYPLDVGAGYPDAYAYTGLLSTFQKARFREAARRSKTRPIMRRTLAPLNPIRAETRAGRGRSEFRTRGVARPR